MAGGIRLTIPDLEARIARALRACNVADENADTVSRALTLAEVDGRGGHGLSRVPTYCAQARIGKVDGHARPTARRTARAALMVDAAHGFAFPALDLAVRELAALAPETGIASAGIFRSHHFGVAGHVVERLAEAGFLALVFGNTPAAMAPWGGRKPVYGTNPIAFAAPMPGRAPVVVDLALSGVARGLVLKARQKGEAIPEGWALDVDGQPTTDPAKALAGTMVPLGGAAGGAKGAALAFMVEVLGAALVGANLAAEASSFLDADGPPPAVGQFLIAIDPAAFAGADVFAERISVLAGQIEGQEGARLPGAGRTSRREAAAREGVVVDGKLLAEVDAIGG
ncbi:MAG: Ldh family oxidoreductase [Rhizobiales bacterium]|nr:Ldh family oxidoreductase [Hyphomicrobiales bacterium]